MGAGSLVLMLWQPRAFLSLNPHGTALWRQLLRRAALGRMGGGRPQRTAGGNSAGPAARARARWARGEHSTHEVGKSLGRENRRDGVARRRRACHSHATGQRRHAVAAPGKENGYTTTKLRLLAAAAPQPRVRLKGPEVAANNLRRERDARL